MSISLVWKCMLFKVAECIAGTPSTGGPVHASPLGRSQGSSFTEIVITNFLVISVSLGTSINRVICRCQRPYISCEGIRITPVIRSSKKAIWQVGYDSALIIAVLKNRPGCGVVKELSIGVGKSTATHVVTTRRLICSEQDACPLFVQELS